ncbi:MAG: hypothetical protein JWO12_3640 [Frankiales bacterium]|nr:hypothetical protein [Frankiales bacterium]
MTTLDEWWADAARELGVQTSVEPAVLLDLAREVAHAVQRPAAPLTTYLLGLAVAAGADPVEAAASLSTFAQGWHG